MNPSTKVISCSNLRLDRSQPPSLCDSYRIQTYNLLIRSQMLYSVELRSQKSCDSYRIQTYNLLIRSQMLYSVELRSQKSCDSYRIQTYNLLIRSQMLYSVELRSQKAVRTGLEPVTPCVTGMYSNQLN